MFPDLPALLAFYRLHYLDTTPLIRPAPKRVERVIAKYDFDGSVSIDFPRTPYPTILSQGNQQVLGTVKVKKQ